MEPKIEQPIVSSTEEIFDDPNQDPIIQEIIKKIGSEPSKEEIEKAVWGGTNGMRAWSQEEGEIEVYYQNRRKALEELARNYPNKAEAYKEKINGLAQVIETIKAEKVAKEYLPTEHQAYFDSINAKHFNTETAIGSRFIYDNDFNSFLTHEIVKRGGNLDGDDRDWFIQQGVSPEALLAFCRYIKVESSQDYPLGEVGIIKASELASDTKIKVIRTKPGAPCSLVVEQEKLPETKYATIVIGPNEKAKDWKEGDPEPSTKEMVWTAHPGLPIRPASEDIWEEGSEISVADVIEKLGKDAYLNVKKI